MNKLVDDCYGFLCAVFDGAYGWLDETISIIIFVFVFNFCVKWILKKLHQRFEKQNKIWKDSFVRALYLPLSVYVWFFAFVHAVDLISKKMSQEIFFDNYHLFLKVGLVLSACWFFLRWNNYITQSKILGFKKQGFSIEKGRVDLISKVTTVFVLGIAFFLILEITESNLNTLIAFGGVGGLALAFASQTVISNFFGGLMIYLTHPFAVGDWINLPEHAIEGYVEEIGWYMTRLRTFEKRPIYIPNSMFSKAVVMTPSRMSHRRFKEVIGVRYKDMPVVKKIIHEIKKMLREHPEVDNSQDNLVHLDGFGTYSVDIQVAAYTLTITSEGFAEVKEDLFFRIYQILENNGAEMAYPTSQVFASNIVMN